jgi:hypothetical protein
MAIPLIWYYHFKYSMGWILMVFFCIGSECTSLETPPYRYEAECELNQSKAVDAVLSVEGITFFQVRCEYTEANDV